MSNDRSEGPLAQFSDQLAEVVERVRPSVVRVDDSTRLTATGVIWAQDGTIVATSHGVEQDTGLVVELHDGKRLPASMVGRDEETDIAVLRVEPAGLTPIDRAHDESVRIGQLALALGMPSDLGLHATFGIVSARMETETNGRAGYLLHTDAQLYPGFSGGPLVDTSGRLLGLNNLSYGRGRGVAVGASILEQVIQNIQAGGVKRGYLGVRTQQVDLPEASRTALKLAQRGGLLIISVEPGSAAEKSGLLLGDAILAVNDSETADGHAFRSVLRSRRAGDEVALRILRGGQLQEISVTLGAQE